MCQRHSPGPGEIVPKTLSKGENVPKIISRGEYAKFVLEFLGREIMQNKLRRKKILSDYEEIYAKMCQEGNLPRGKVCQISSEGHCVKLVNRENIPGGEYVKFLKKEKMPKMQ